jgi:hypothetical protein
MNLFQIISDLAQADPEVLERINDRRSALSALGDISKKMALAAAPIAIGAAFNKTLAQGAGSSVTSILNYALSLERLESAFYNMAIGTGTTPGLVAGLSTSAMAAGIRKIRDDEAAHVLLLEAALGNAANPRPTGYNFAVAFTDIPTFLTYAQAFEDTGVRAYKGQAGYIPRGATVAVTGVGTVNVLKTALQIHAVEARHAAYVRYQRRAAANGGQNQFGWITLAQANGAPAPVYGPGSPAASFPSEANTTHVPTIDLLAMGSPAYTAAEVSEAFDEPLDSATVLSIAGPFIIP